MAIDRISSRQLDLGPVQYFEPRAETPPGNQIEVNEGWFDISGVITYKALQLTVGFLPVGILGQIRWDLVYLDFTGLPVVVPGTPQVAPVPDFTGAAVAPVHGFPIAYVQVDEVGAVVVTQDDITDIRPKFVLFQDRTYRVVPYAVTNTNYHGTEIGALDAAVEASSSFAGRTNPTDSAPDYSGQTTGYYINTNDPLETAVGKIDGGVALDIPVTGMIIWHSVNSPPSGWLECDGSAISRAVYADLFAALAETWGPGDGINTFNIPDLRGEFVRGWDNGRGVDSGRSFPSTQAEAFLAHNHSMGNINSYSDFQTGGAKQGWHDGGSLVYTSTDGGTETRPRNVTLMACIKY